MRRDRLLAKTKDKISATISTTKMGCPMPTSSTPAVARLIEIRSTLPSASLSAQYIVFCSSVEE